MLTIKAVFHLPLRATEGFLRSLAKLMRMATPVPDHSTLNRRQKQLAIKINRSPQPGAIHAVIDSTGLKVFGEGARK